MVGVYSLILPFCASAGEVDKPWWFRVNERARWLVSQSDYATVSTFRHTDGLPAANIFSTAADQHGLIYMMIPDRDAEADLVKNPLCSVAFTEAGLAHKGFYCTNNSAESPLCTHLTITGRLSRVHPDAVEFARKLILAAHPDLQSLGENVVPYHMAAEDIVDMFFLDMYGPSKHLDVAKYMAASPMSERAAIQKPVVRQLSTEAETARGLLHKSDFVVVSTSHMIKDTPAPFGNVLAVADDHRGAIYGYVMTTGTLGKDVLAHTDVALTFSEKPLGSCEGSAQGKTCKRLTLRGKFTKVPKEQRLEARRLLFSKFKIMHTWPADHGFEFFWMSNENIKEIYTMNFDGSVEYISKQDWVQSFSEIVTI